MMGMLMFFDDDECTAANAAEVTRQTLIDTQQRLGVMMDVMPMGLLIHTRQGIIYANQEAARLLGSDQRDLIGRHFLDYLDADSGHLSVQIDRAFAGAGGIETSEGTITALDGSVRTVRIIAGALPWQGNPVIQLLLQDITDLKLIQQKLELLSYTDELTGAYNRRHAFTLANEIMGNAITPLAVVLLDLDRFKSVNDRYGHSGGDLALKALTETARATLATCSLSDPVFARIGGEEFMVLLPQASLRQAVELAERLRTDIEGIVVRAATGTFRFTASFGVAARRPSHTAFQEIVSEADEALYCAKANGRNCVVTGSCDAPLAIASVQSAER
jgi:diguanylate cyclase